MDRERERERERSGKKKEAPPKRRPEDQEAPGGQVTHDERKGSADREPEEPHGESEAV